MTKNVTVLTDENGVQREYNGVKRKANVGERIKIINKPEYEGRYNNGDVLTAIESGSAGITVENPNAGVWHLEYTVLEPTSTIIIDGVRYREEKRKAAVGDLIYYPNDQRLATVIADSDGPSSGERTYYSTAMAYSHLVLTPIAESVTPASAPTPQAITFTVHVTVASMDDAVQAVADAVKAELAKFDPHKAVASVLMTQPKPKSPQELRDEIVERAKADVAELISQEDGLRVRDERGPHYSPYICRANFVVNSEKRTVVALLTGINSGKVRAKGVAKCAPGDVFNSHIGRAIALRRALGLAVPPEYTSAPKPTEVRVGMAVRVTNPKRTNVYEHVVEKGGVGYVVALKPMYAYPVSISETKGDSLGIWTARDAFDIVDDSEVAE